MPANKQAALRYQIINRCLRNKYKPYPSKEDLRQACEDALFNSSGDRISMSTIDKDIYALRNDLTLGYEAPIKFSKEYGGYFYEDPEYSIDKFPLGEEHLEAIRFAAATLEQFKDTPLFSQFESVIGKISDRVNITSVNEKSVDQYVQFEWAPKAGGAEFLPELFGAIQERKEIEIEYASFESGVPKPYTIQAYLLKEYRNRWYLIGYALEKSFFATFALDRLKSVHITDETFKKDEGFDSNKFFKHSFGITSSHEAEVWKVRLKFSPRAGQYIKSQSLHPSQQIIEDTADYLTVSYELMPSYELEQAILGFGEEIEVLGPQALRDRITERLSKASDAYQKSS